jgi:hypothetical protein
MANVCPVCQKDDQIKKIAAIHMEGGSTGAFVGPMGGITILGGKLGITSGMTSLSGHSVTDLAQFLSPPEEPKEYSSKILVPLCIIGIAMLLYGFVTGIGLAIGGILLLIIAAAIGFYKQSSDMNEYSFRNKTEVDTWKKHMEIYNRLFYCSRDYISFDPNTGEYRPLMETWQLFQ